MSKIVILYYFCTMYINMLNYNTIINELKPFNATLVAVSKTKPIAAIQELYNLGQRDFGENYVQELLEKYEQLPKDIRWHFIGHLQSNKVKYITPFIYLVHGVTSKNLLLEIQKQGQKIHKKINCLLQVYIAKEDTKFGFSVTDLETEIEKFKQFENINLCGFMGMASNSDEKNQVKNEFQQLQSLFQKHFTKNQFLSMGMSGDFKIALTCGSNIVRIGSLLFGQRNYTIT